MTLSKLRKIKEKKVSYCLTAFRNLLAFLSADNAVSSASPNGVQKLFYINVDSVTTWLFILCWIIKNDNLLFYQNGKNAFT